MISDIVFFAGGSTAGEPVDRFRWIHPQFFAESAVVLVHLSDIFPPPQYKPDDIPSLIADPAFAPLARQKLEALLRDRPVRPEVLLLQNLMLHKRPHLLALQSALCRHFFPDVRQRAIYVASPADREVEAECTRALVYGSPLAMPLYVRQCAKSRPFLEKSLTTLEEHFGADAVTIIPFGNEEQTCREFAAALLRTMPGAQEGVFALHFTPSPISAFLPRDVLAFMEGVNQLYAASGAGTSPHTWRKFVPFLRGGTHSSQLLSPELRAELHQKFDAADIKALASRKLPPWICREERPDIHDENGFSGLTDEDCLRLAKLLPQEHVDILLKGPHLPEECQTYGARQCLRAMQSMRGARELVSHGAAIPAQPKLSVLTLTYNHACYIAECIESVIAQQTSFPIQHIIADDCSDDGAQDIILDYAAKYPHIVPVFQRKRSGSNNIAALFNMARTEYVALCDGDDYFMNPDKLQMQADFLDAHRNAALCFHVVRVVYEDGSKPERLYPVEASLPRGVRPFYYLGDLFKCNFIQTNSAMYRWRFRNGLPDWFRTNIVPADWYWHLLHAEIGKIGFINKVMSVYRRHAKGIYYQAEIDQIAHRATVAMQELEVYDVVNKHFGGKYESSLLELANGVFSACLLHNRQADDQDEELLAKLCEAYPDFARHYLGVLKRAGDA